MVRIEFTPAQVAAIRELIEGEIDIVDRNKTDAEYNFPEEVPGFVAQLNELDNLLVKFPLPSEA